MIDHDLTIKIKQWLESEHTDDDNILQGAMYLLKLNRNQILFNTVARQPQRYLNKVVYELKKFLPMRIASMTMDDVNRQEAVVLPEIKKVVEAEPADAEETGELPLRKGKRADHDQLPENIQNIWPINAERWKKIKEAYNTCLTLTEPCDRYELVHVLKGAWYDYKRDFNTYDEFVLEPANDGDKEPVVLTPEMVKTIENAKKYIFDNLDELKKRRETSLSDDATDKQIKAYNTRYAAVVERLQLLIKYGIEVSDNVKERLAEGGIDYSLMGDVPASDENVKNSDNAESEASDSDAAEAAE